MLAVTSIKHGASNGIRNILRGILNIWCFSEHLRHKSAEARATMARGLTSSGCHAKAAFTFHHISLRMSARTSDEHAGMIRHAPRMRWQNDHAGASVKSGLIRRLHIRANKTYLYIYFSKMVWLPSKRLILSRPTTYRSSARAIMKRRREEHTR